jgi:hypothetical protein
VAEEDDIPDNITWFPLPATVRIPPQSSDGAALLIQSAAVMIVRVHSTGETVPVTVSLFDKNQQPTAPANMDTVKTSSL